MLKRQISIDEAAGEGFNINHEEMPNGLQLYRLGSRYTAIVGGLEGVWRFQYSHYHRFLSETYVVVRQWVVFVEMARDGQLKLHRLHKGSAITSKPGVPYNVYIAAGAQVDTLKISVPDNVDWCESPELDALIRPLAEQDIFRLAKVKKKNKRHRRQRRG